MKKFLISFLVVLMLVMSIPVSAKRIGDVPEVTNHEKVNIYLFWASWCLVHVVVVAGSVGSRNISKGVLGVQQIITLARYPIPDDGHFGLAFRLA